jgi:hypothetical protein
MTHVDGAVACAIVDLDARRLIGFHAHERTEELEAAVLAATLALLYRSPKAASGSARLRAHEAHVTSEHGYHFAKVLEGGKAAVMLVTNRTANAGMGSAQLRAAIPKVKAVVP